MSPPHLPRPIERSRHRFGWRLTFAALVFATLLAADLFITGHLVFRDLGVRMRKEVISSAQQRALGLAQALAAQGQIDLYRVHSRRTVISSYVDQVLTGERFVTTVTFYDAVGRVVRTWKGRGGRVFPSGPGFHFRETPLDTPGIESDEAESTPSYRLDTRERERYIAVPIPPSGEPSGGAVEVGIDEEQLRREIDALRRSLIMKIVVGAAISVLLLMIAFVYVMRLLSKTRRLEAEAQMADRLAYVGTLASGLAHEIRNPLNAMNMNLQMLEEEVSAGTARSDPEAAQLLHSTKGEVRRLETLVNDFLAYARPAEPRLALADLNRTVAEILGFLGADLHQKGIHVVSELDQKIPPVEVDEAQIRQALMNVLINAKEVLGPGGRIRVATETGVDGEAVVRIEDNGPGIPPEIRPRIFEVFFSTRGGGSGLGLPIAQRILESHGGWIDLQTEPGKGTTFLLHLRPRNRAEPRGAPAVARPA